MTESAESNTKQKYEDYGAHKNEYDQYSLTEEDEILREMNMKYSKKGAYVVLALVAAGFSAAAITMSQKWVPHKPTTTISITTTTSASTTISTTPTTTAPPVDPDQVRFYDSYLNY